MRASVVLICLIGFYSSAQAQTLADCVESTAIAAAIVNTMPSGADGARDTIKQSLEECGIGWQDELHFYIATLEPETEDQYSNIQFFSSLVDTPGAAYTGSLDNCGQIPDAPNVPDGHLASLLQMQRAQADIRAYVDTMETILDCINHYHEWIVAEMERTARAFNDEIERFRERR